MSVIIANDKEELIKALKKMDEHVFKVTKEIIYAIPESMVSYHSNYDVFLKFAKEHPEKVFLEHYKILTEVKNVEEV